MVSSVYIAAAVAIVFAVYTYFSRLYRNIKIARQVGLPYVVSPCSPYFIPMRMSWPIWEKIILLFPERYWKGWLFCLFPDWNYVDGQKPWERLGDSFFIVSPGDCALYTQDPDVIYQVSFKREQYHKATRMYSVLEIYGRNVVTTEGPLWRMHRKITSASFNEKNAAQTFRETIHQAKGLIGKWVSLGANATIHSLEADTMTVALNVIGYVGFGIRFLWPGETLPPDADLRVRKYGSLTPPEGHNMTFADALERSLHHITLILVFPAWFLRLCSTWSTTFKEAYNGNDNYERYMDEFLKDKIEATQAGDHGDGTMDIMGQLVRSRYDDSKTKKTHDTAMPDSHIIGNAFIMIVAGHETSANTLHFSLAELALNPSSQRAVQADMDRIFGGADPSTWVYEDTINSLQASMVGATMYECLRVIPPVVNIPKWVPGPSGAVLTAEGKTYSLPQGVSIMISCVSAHRNPKYWPSQPSKVTGASNDLDDFVPERWLQNTEPEAEDEVALDGADNEDYGGYKGPDINAHLFHPSRGTYVPFSEGPRSCLGRRIAQVELLVTMAMIFQKYSLELAVDEFADDDAVNSMDEFDRKALYRKAQEKTQKTLNAARTILTLKLHEKYEIPVRLVPRGQERFVNIC